MATANRRIEGTPCCPVLIMYMSNITFYDATQIVFIVRMWNNQLPEPILGENIVEAFL